MFPPQLEEARAAVQERPREVGGQPARPRGDVSVDDGVKTREDVVS